MDKFQYNIPPAGDFNWCSCRSLVQDKTACQSTSGVYDRQKITLLDSTLIKPEGFFCDPPSFGFNNNEGARRVD